MNGRAWTDPELTLLAEMYPHCSTADVAAWLGRREGTVYMAANSRGIRKSAEYLASVSSGRIRRGRQDPRMVATQFRKCQESWSKGTKGLVGVQEACRATQFKPGRRPEESRNYKPIGSLRVNCDGILERKVTDDRSIVPARRWVAVARLVWEAAHGPIPAGHIVCFRPGLHTTDADLLTVDRLECITRAENARRNHPRTRSPELGKLVQLKGAITRVVNRIAREAQENRT